MSALTLYQITEQYRQAFAELSADDLPTEVMAAALEGLRGEVTLKAANVAAFCLNLEVEAEAIRTVEERLAKRRAALEARAECLRGYLLSHMQAAGITEIEALDHSFRARVRANPPTCIIDDERNLPGWATETVVSTKVHKADIAQRLKAGEAVPGAHLEQGYRLEIR